MTLFIGDVQDRQIRQTGSGFVVPGPGGGGWGVTAHGDGVSFGGSEKVLEPDRGGGYTTL